MNQYLKVQRGDKVLVDLGGYGVELCLANDSSYYIARYVSIKYPKGRASANPMKADMDVNGFNDFTPTGPMSVLLSQADRVKIWRHKAK